MKELKAFARLQTMPTTLARVYSRLELADGGWFDSLTDEQKKGYLEDHPDSKYAKDYKKKQDDDKQLEGKKHNKPENKENRADWQKYYKERVGKLSPAERDAEIKEAQDKLERERDLPEDSEDFEHMDKDEAIKRSEMMLDMLKPKKEFELPNGKPGKKSFKERIENLPHKLAKVFTSGAHKPGSEERSSVAEQIKKKKDVLVSGIKNEVKEFGTAANGVKKLLNGGELDHHDKEAFKAVTKHVLLAGLYMAAGGGLAHGLMAAAAHLPEHVLTAVVVESLGAAAFASEMSDDEAMGMFVDHLAEAIRSADIDQDTWADAADVVVKTAESD